MGTPGTGSPGGRCPRGLDKQRRGGEGEARRERPGCGWPGAGAQRPCPQLLGLWDSPRSRELLPGLLRADRSPFCARRDVSRRCRLRPGHYLVVPSATHAGDEADFTLRVFSERRHTAV